jgi:DNA polymerase-1
MKPPRVDVAGWLANAETMEREAAEKEAEIGFNVYSHKVTKGKIEAALGRSIKSTNAKETLEPELAKLDQNSPTAKLIRNVLEVRELRKAAETYGKSWIEQHADAGGYVHPSWRVTGAETGRMSCGSPNLQNVPARKRPIFRTFFTASEGNVLQIADVSGQEPAFSAYLSADQVMIDEIERGIKSHQVVADLFNVDYDTGKAVNLALNYGMSAWGLSKQVGISEEAAEAGILARSRHYREFTTWMSEQKRFAARHFYVQTVTGRRVWINPYNGQGQWERNSFNGPIQGSAADHTKAALVANHRLCKEAGLEFRVTGVIHDELLQDVPLGGREVYRHILQRSWDEASARLAPGIPMKIAIVEGNNWGAKNE